MPDKAPFTQAREELLARMEAESAFGDVQHWYEFGDGVADRFDVQPSDCPYVAVFPQESGEDRNMNAARKIPQGLTVEIGTAGQDVEPLERLHWDFLLFLKGSVRNDHLGLASEGLGEIAITNVSWGLFPGKDAAKPKWVVSHSLELVWRVI